MKKRRRSQCASGKRANKAWVFSHSSFDPLAVSLLVDGGAQIAASVAYSSDSGTRPMFFSPAAFFSL